MKVSLILIDWRGVARDYGATRFAVHVSADGASIHDTRANGKRSNPPKIWTLDQIDQTLAEYEGLFLGLRDPFIRCIWVSAMAQSSLPDSLEAIVVKLEDTKKQVTPPNLTPYEQAVALFGPKS